MSLVCGRCDNFDQRCLPGATVTLDQASHAQLIAVQQSDEITGYQSQGETRLRMVHISLSEINKERIQILRCV